MRVAPLILAALLAPLGAAAETTVVNGGLPKVFVDVSHCQWTSTLCSGSGSIGAATGGNSSIVAFYYHGTTSGLLQSSFTLSSVTNPGGVTPVFVSSTTCPACFAEPQPGVYRLATRPAFGNWATGSYVVLLTVTRPTGVATTVLVPIDIP